MTLIIVRYLIVILSVVSFATAFILDNGWALANGISLLFMFGASLVDE